MLNCRCGFLNALRRTVQTRSAPTPYPHCSCISSDLDQGWEAQWRSFPLGNCSGALHGICISQERPTKFGPCSPLSGVNQAFPRASACITLAQGLPATILPLDGQAVWGKYWSCGSFIMSWRPQFKGMIKTSRSTV
jgi:hypothetical protein